ncbi:heavy metal translocating P-type ATPase [Clostridium grantii]|uniref:Cd(2+)-exporting ATPase n=1 Tax=Clostridium grantii DSM 8605 TaxID=1121316 RepID=A0A1M5UHN0_9CLOT|nr:heavy metal translocating P-type ATPase [Clostridium grantii]SHH62562.1 Cd2+/Zn2+-exporting ATPase [Clostridium grantii DSM 8605]
MKNKVEITLQGLNCASCAGKIENKVKTLAGIENVNLNFARSILTVDTKNTNKDEVVEQVRIIVDNTERGVKVELLDKSVKKKEDKNKITIAQHINKKDFIVLMVGLAIFALALINGDNKYALIFYLLSYAIIGGTIIQSAFTGIKSGELLDENFLMVIATLAAFFIGEYPEAVAVMIFYRIGELFQDAAVERSRKSISDIMDIRPDYANLYMSGISYKVDPDKVNIGDIIEVRTGEKIPLDGIIVEGKASLNTSALTGESLPVDVCIDSEVYSGSINLNGLLKIKVTKVFGESTVSKILDLVENASNSKGKTEKFITKFAKIYTPVVVIVAVILAIVPPFIFNNGTFSEWIYTAAIFLVVSCPCALVISIPLGYFAGLGLASKNGILIKGSNYLEALYNVKAIAFDKTGTLTKGIFVVQNVESTSEFTKEDVLKYAAIAESNSQHPIAKAIVNENKLNLKDIEVLSYEEIAGMGIKVTIKEENNTKTIIVGNKILIEELGMEVTNITNIGTHIYVGMDKAFIGYLTINDEAKKESKKSIEELNRMGIKNLTMITGDNQGNAMYFAEKLNIKNVFHSLLPADKVKSIENIKNSMMKNEKIIFVGDGINDAPVLARADIGVAMGGIGSDAAIEAADVVIMDDDMNKIAKALQIAKTTRIIVMQNIIFSIGIKLLVLLLAAFGRTSMWIAIFADVGVALLAVLNSMRILKE